MNRVRKQQITNTAIDLFAKYGIANVSIVRLSKEIGASKGMIYYYFRNGKSDIISEILHIYEDCVNTFIPETKDWESRNADAKEILCKLFFQFRPDDLLRMRKIVRIIMSEMYHDEQIASYAMKYFIIGREKQLADCFFSLQTNGKIISLDTESAARYFNRLLVVCAMEDALRYPYIDDKEKAEAQNNRTIRDCTNFINHILVKDKHDYNIESSTEC